MRIVIIHHHLRAGGVTRIIQSQIKSIRKYQPDLQIKLLVGECDIEQDFYEEYGVDLCIHPELNYLDFFIKEDIIDESYEKVKKILSDNIAIWDIVHAHNFNLGKNPLVTLALSELAQEGYMLVNHAHDFAEDRTTNHNFLKRVIENHFGKNLNKVLYPGFDKYKFAVLNLKDFERLKRLHIPEENITLLPNPAPKPENLKLAPCEECRQKICDKLGLDPDKKIFTYPVRAITRKNIGEYILLAELFAEEANWLITLPPQNPIELVEYNKWKEFADNNGIDVRFEVGHKVDFDELISATDACITTSVQEGFGMVFLEPWLLDTPVMGRDLSYVTSYILNSGLEFNLLYDEISVNKNGKTIDFGKLSSDDQKRKIVECINSEEEKEAVKSDNGFLQLLFEDAEIETIEKNKEAIIENFSLEKYAQTLYEIYSGFFR